MKTEQWNGYLIRFVNIKGEWWAVLSDSANALALEPKHMKERLVDEVVLTDHVSDSLGRKQKMLVVSEFGIYDAIFSSRKPQAKQFKRWVFNIIKQLRESVGIEEFQVFRMMDKEHQKKMMANLNQSLSKPCPRDFIKANTITNKAVSTMNGYQKMVKKGDMTPEMLVQREPILKDTVDLISTKEKFNLDISVSKAIYGSLMKK